jgi:hypothetical protein
MIKKSDLQKLKGKISESTFKTTHRRKYFTSVVKNMEMCLEIPSKTIYKQHAELDRKISKIMSLAPEYARNNNCKTSVFYKIMELKLKKEQKRFLEYMINPDLFSTYMDNFIYKN